MKIVEIANPKRVNKKPNKSIILFSGKLSEKNFVILKVELRQYIEKDDDKKGPYSLITSYVETDRGSVEMKYDEGFLGKNALQDTSDFLTKNLGLGGLIQRSLVSLEAALNQKT